MSGLEIDIPEVVAEVEAAFARYEEALVRTTSRPLELCSSFADAHHPLRRRRESIRHRGDPRLRAGRSPAAWRRTLAQ